MLGKHVWVVHVQVLAFLKPQIVNFTKGDNEEFPTPFFGYNFEWL
jgi:hypothetical protein